MRTPASFLLAALLVAAAIPIFGDPAAAQPGARSAAVESAVRSTAPPPNEAKRYEGWKISGYSVQGMPGGLEDDLKSGLALSGRRKWIVLKRYPVFDAGDHAQDVERTRLFLARNGYPWAVVRSGFEPNAKGRSVTVTILVEHGPAVRVAGNVTEAFPPKLEPEAASVLELEPEEVFTDTKVEERQKELLDILARAGYARSEIATEIRPTDDSTKVEVAFLVDAGIIYHFGETIIEGIGSDLHDVVHHSVGIEPGTRYDPGKLERASETLRLTELFSKIRLTLQPPRADTLDILADLNERAPRSLQVNAGYWTEDQLRARALWRHRNLLEAGRGLGVEASYSQFNQGASLSIWKPAMFHSRFRGVATVRALRESEENYELRAGELELAGNYVHSMAVSLRPSITASRIDFRRLETAGEEIADPGPSLLTLSLAWTYDTLDDKIYPHRGTYSTIAPEYGLPSFGTRNDFFRIRPEATHYLPLGGPITLAGRLRIGYALPQTDALDLLPNRRFYAGGSGSVRGFERRRLGPRDEDGDPIGGMASLESAVEIQVPLFWLLTGAVFFDAGQVWRTRGDVDLGGLEYAAGPGIGLRTPVGPVRADLGFRLSPKKGEPRSVLHISIGQAF